MKPSFFPHERRVFRKLKAKGFDPKVVYDIGASTGIWSEVIAGVFPEAEFHMFEPLADKVDGYRTDLAGRLPRLPNLHLHPVALGASSGTATLFVTEDGYASSLHEGGEVRQVKERARVPQYRLDEYAAENNLPAPDVIKIDCQGAEDAILRGGLKRVRQAKVVLLETWLRRDYGPGTPLLCEIVEYLRVFSFSPVEIGERFYDSGHRLYSFDVFFFAESLLQQGGLAPPSPAVPNSSRDATR
jgi:FkbM family methyltransferase